MTLEKLDKNVEIIKDLSTYPNQEEGLSAEELKARFDEGAKIIKEYLNSEVVRAVNAAVTVEPQEFTPEQQAQARKNIGAAEYGTLTLEHVNQNGSVISQISVTADQPEIYDNGYVKTGVIEFFETNHDGRVQLAHIADGTKDDHAATVGQVKKFVEGAGGGGQVAPEFANSIEECTDQSKLYVLPDGYIYAYMKTTGPLFDNQLKNAVDENGEPFNNGIGFIDGYLNYAGNVDPSGAANYGDCMYTGFVPYNGENQIVITGVHPIEQNAESTVSVGRLLFFGSDKTLTASANPTVLSLVNEGSATYDPNGLNGYGVFTFDLAKYKEFHAWTGGQIATNAKYIRFAWYYSTSKKDAYILYDEELVFGEVYAWTNTGHAFVSSDYEDRIVALEETAESHEGRLKDLEDKKTDPSSSAEIPEYIKTEAEGVMDRVAEKQGSRTFNLLAISDMHFNTWDGVRKGVITRAAQAVAYIKSHMHIDAIATLGDNLDLGGGTLEELARAHKWSRQLNEILDETQGVDIVNFRTPGNHDRLGNPDTEGGSADIIFPDAAIHNYITGYNSKNTYNNVPVGYGYNDFDNYKLRVIQLNTAECEGRGRFNEYDGFRISTAQYKWLIDTLVMSDKADADKWQILILSHHAPHAKQETFVGGDTNNGYILPNILNAYINGTEFSAQRPDGDLITCDFTGKNAARLVCAIHGHYHSYQYNLVRLGSAYGGNFVKLYHITTPMSRNITDEEGGNPDNKGNKFTSTIGTSTETAFCVYCIDLDGGMVNAIHYGNGIDRSFDYVNVPV